MASSREVATAAEDLPGMTIDELASRTGVTIRTLRLYQTKSLLPPPRLSGRVGYYSDAHVNRLLTIERLQARGFSLAGIGELIRMWEQGQGIDELLGYERILAAPWSDEEPVRLDRDELLARFPGFVDEALRRRAVDAGVLEADGDGYWLSSPNLLEFGAVLVQRGVPPEVALRELQQLHDDLGAIAARFIALFRSYILPRYVTPDALEWLPKVAGFEKLYRPALRTLVAGVFTRQMDRAAKAAREAVERIAGLRDASRERAR